MAKHDKVSGYEAFLAILPKYEKYQLNVYFSGQKDNKGDSWCSDCNTAEPEVFKALNEYADKDSVFLTVDVGDRTFWKDMKNPFRLNKDLHLSVIPTLICWGKVGRLEGDQCAKNDLLELFFSEGSQ